MPDVARDFVLRGPDGSRGAFTQVRQVSGPERRLFRRPQTVVGYDEYHFRAMTMP